jgi:hypothetical protein
MRDRDGQSLSRASNWYQFLQLNVVGRCQWMSMVLHAVHREQGQQTKGIIWQKGLSDHHPTPNRTGRPLLNWGAFGRGAHHVLSGGWVLCLGFKSMGETRFGSSRLLITRDIHVLRREFWEGACAKMTKKGNVFWSLSWFRNWLDSFGVSWWLVVWKCEILLAYLDFW